jgi:hypothetical protein
METKISGKRVEKMANALGFGGCYAVDSVGLSGGIGLFWKKEASVEVKSYNQNHIDVIVKAVGDDVRPWRFTGFYGEPRKEDRHVSWTLLRRLANALDYPWLCLGDFNETLYGSEHFSVSERSEPHMRAFRECIDDCSLVDLGWNGVPYTWDNRQDGDANVKSRIDRGLGNQKLYDEFAVPRVQHINMVESDHCALLIRMQRKDQISIKKNNHCFRYENVWQTRSEYDQQVQKL